MSDIVQFRIVFRIISRILFILAAALMLNGLVALVLKEKPAPFLYSTTAAFIPGLFLLVLTGRTRDELVLHKKDAYFTVTFAWLIMGLVGCLPYLISGAIPNFTNAFFESVSGFTTTGSSILTDIEALPRSVLFWRSLSHWIGGIGIIVLVIIIMPAMQMGGYHLFTMESSLQEKIKPRIKAVGTRLLFIYLLLTTAEIILLIAGDMNLFESVCHAFGTVATGGFSPKNDSIAGYSPYIQYVIMIFMILAGTNFVIHYYLFTGNKNILKINEEFRFYLIVVVFFGSVITTVLYLNQILSLEESFRHAFFQVISIITCTGFATADYLQWPVFAWGIIFLCMFLGGSTGSTAGGIKMVRHLILLKNLVRNIKTLLFPNAIISMSLNKKPVSDALNSSVMTFIFVYFLIFVAGSVFMVFLGNSPSTSSSAVATCMAGIGPGLGSIGPVANFAHLSDLSKFLLSGLMITGRLEIYTVLILFTPNYWKKA